MKRKSLEQNELLISGHFAEKKFRKLVILTLYSNPQKTVGIVLNKVKPLCQNKNTDILQCGFGGYQEMNQVNVLHTKQGNHSSEISEGIFITDDLTKTFDPNFESEIINDTMRVFSGYMEWETERLFYEMMRLKWVTFRPEPHNLKKIIFTYKSEGLWKRMLRKSLFQSFGPNPYAGKGN